MALLYAARADVDLIKGRPTLRRTIHNHAPLLVERRFFAKAISSGAGLIFVVFVVAHLCGLREYTSVLNGTTGSMAYPRTPLVGVLYVLIYLGTILGVPMLLIAAALMTVGSNGKPESKIPLATQEQTLRRRIMVHVVLHHRPVLQRRNGHPAQPGTGLDGQMVGARRPDQRHGYGRIEPLAFDYSRSFAEREHEASATLLRDGLAGLRAFRDCHRFHRGVARPGAQPMVV